MHDLSDMNIQSMHQTCSFAPKQLYFVANQVIHTIAALYESKQNKTYKIIINHLINCTHTALASRTHTMLTHEMQIVEITADVVPQPITTAVEHNTILFAIVIVRLVFAPCWLQHCIACHIYQQINVKTIGETVKKIERKRKKAYLNLGICIIRIETTRVCIDFTELSRSPFRETK